MMKIIKQKLPNAKLVLTLHEYYAICNNSGLMIKTGGQNKLCFESGTRECNGCFPDKSPGDFFLRKEYIMSCFEMVDTFIAPSAFLRQRYIDWGISSEAIHVVENGQLENVAPTVKLNNTDKVSIVYIGQINLFKGVDVLLDALLLIPKELRQQLCIDIHGANFDSQPTDFQEKVHAQLKRLKGVVRMHGSYEPSELTNILGVTSWVVVPSIWWENSPMVIQEALNHQKPVIVSDIGGMAEKIKHNKTGLHFRAGSPVSLADALQKILNDPDLGSALAKNINAPLTLSESYIKINKIIS